MKTKIIRTALFISLFALSFGCDNNADLSGDLSQDINAKDQATQQVYPVEIQATDFSLPEGCGWKSPAKGEPDIYVIRSVEDILPLIDGEFSESLIDFEKYSLVYARGGCTSGIVDITKRLQQISGNEYLLNVNITNNILAVAPLWNIAIQVPVISQDTEIKLDVNAFPKHIALVQIAQEDLHGNGKEGFSRESIVIKTDSEWEAFKQKINTTNNVVDAYFTETEIDFSAYQIIAVFDEVKGNGGWSIDITGITEWQDKILISVTNLKKGGATSVMTQPFQIIKIPVSDKEIVFEYDLDENLNISLKGTKWKLTSFVFAADGSIKEPKPSGNSYFTVYFAPDSKTLTGFSSTNELFGEYEIDDQASTIKIKQLGGTKINEQYDGKLFVDNLLSIHSFSVEDKDLKLYYNELGDYLLFTVYRDLENEPSPDLTIADFNIPADCGVSYAKMQHDSIYMINSKEEWASIFTCETNPQVDFSTKTLFVAFGSTTNGISNISKKLLFENNAYSLTVDVTLDMTAVAQGWHIILITDKINMQSVILNLNKHFGNENL